jgi:hypothetical protein
VTDSLGTDTLLFPASGNISTLNVGGAATPLLAGVEQILLNTTGVLTVRDGQFAGQAQTINVISGTGSAGITLNAAGVLNASGVVGTALAAGAYNTAAGVASGVGIALATLTLTGSAGIDTITTAPTIANIIVDTDGVDAMVLGTGADVVTLGAFAAELNTISGFDAGTSTTTVDRIGFDVVGSGLTSAFASGTLSTALAKMTSATADPTALAAGNTPVLFTVGADDAAAGAATANILVFSTAYANAAALQTAIQTAGGNTVVTGSDATVTATKYLAVYLTTGVGLKIAVITTAANATTTEGSSVVDIVTLTGLTTVANLDAGDFLFS